MEHLTPKAPAVNKVIITLTTVALLANQLLAQDFPPQLSEHMDTKVRKEMTLTFGGESELKLAVAEFRSDCVFALRSLDRSLATARGQASRFLRENPESDEPKFLFANHEFQQKVDQLSHHKKDWPILAFRYKMLRDSIRLAGAITEQQRINFVTRK